LKKIEVTPKLPLLVLENIALGPIAIELVAQYWNIFWIIISTIYAAGIFWGYLPSH